MRLQGLRLEGEAEIRTVWIITCTYLYIFEDYVQDRSSLKDPITIIYQTMFSHGEPASYCSKQIWNLLTAVCTCFGASSNPTLCSAFVLPNYTYTKINISINMNKYTYIYMYINIYIYIYLNIFVKYLFIYIYIYIFI